MGTTTQQQTSCTFHSHQIVCGTNYFLPRATAVGTKSQPGSDVRNSCLLSITYHGQPYLNPPAPNVCDVLYYPSSFHCHASVCGLLIACFLIFFGDSLIANTVKVKSVRDKNNSTNNFIELEKSQIHSGITLTVFAMSESPKFRQITKIQISYRKKE